MLAVIPLLLATLSIVSARPVSNDRRNDLVSGSWSYAGCFEGVVMRFQSYQINQTVESCLSSCSHWGFPVAGLSRMFCTCIDSMPVTPSTPHLCTYPCPGNATQHCGGFSTTSVYTTTTITNIPIRPTDLLSYNSWSPFGCFVDSADNHTLPVPMQIQGGDAALTVEGCLDTCKAGGYTFGGVENGVECYCGMHMPQTLAMDNRCQMACGGDSTELCGGPDGISVYHSFPDFYYGHWKYVGCYADSLSNRVLPNQIFLDHFNVTVESCLDSCSEAGYAYAGLEEAGQCWCGDLMPTQRSDVCFSGCTGDPDETCGGRGVLSVFKMAPPSQTTTPNSLPTSNPPSITNSGLI